mmetsp:Transcript_19923/g.30335  ORF Transcript_19923/g.30335 Transcript_19923/m.30335 type:complete len:747 (-) Transcript_19923:920-3160(-)
MKTNKELQYSRARSDEDDSDGDLHELSPKSQQRKRLHYPVGNKIAIILAVTFGIIGMLISSFQVYRSSLAFEDLNDRLLQSEESLVNASMRIAMLEKVLKSVETASEYYQSKLESTGEYWAEQLNVTASLSKAKFRQVLEEEEAEGLILLEESIQTGTQQIDQLSQKANDTAFHAAAKAEAAATRATKTSVAVESKNRAVLASLNASASRAVATLEASVTAAEARLESSRQAVDLLEREIELKSQQVNELQSKVETYEASTESRFDKQNALLRSWVAGFFALSATVLTLRHVYAHATHMASPDAQRKVLAILWMVPIYASTSWAAIVWPKLCDELALISSFYEAYCIHIFFSLLVAVLSAGRGEDTLDDPRELLGPDVDNVALKAPFCSHFLCCDICFFSNEKIDILRLNNNNFSGRSISQKFSSSCAPSVVSASVFLRRCQLATLQFTILKPALSILQFVFDRSVPRYRDAPITDYTKPTLWITLLLNASVSLALAGLFAFFHATQHNPRLIPHKPWPKFLAIKCVVFLTWLQGVLINGFFFSDAKLANAFQNFLVCVEMFTAALAHTHIFGAEEWQPNYIPVELAATSLADNLALHDFLKDLKSVLPKRYRRRSANLGGGASSQNSIKNESPTQLQHSSNALKSDTTSNAVTALSIVQALRSPVASDDEDELSPQPSTRRSFVVSSNDNTLITATEKGEDELKLSTDDDKDTEQDDAHLLPRRRIVGNAASSINSGKTEFIDLV